MSLGLLPRVSPHIHTMPSHQNSIGLGILTNRLTETISELVFMCSVLYNRYNQLIIVSMALDPLYHLLVGQAQLALALEDAGDEVCAESVGV